MKKKVPGAGVGQKRTGSATLIASRTFLKLVCFILLKYLCNIPIFPSRTFVVIFLFYPPKISLFL